MNQKLGTNQTKWLEALRSGEYQQGDTYLCYENKYCCLGVAAEIFQTENTHIGLHANDTTKAFDGSIFSAPPYVVETLGLYSDKGGSVYVGHPSLAGLNDDGVPFKDIADRIEANPDHYFKESL
jgi:hypothetical protein